MRGGVPSKLVDRRIALLFAVFAGLLTFAVLRAAYLGTIKAPKLKRAAISQQVAVVDVPARRGTITDRHGVDLAVSEPAVDVAVDPLIVKQPLVVARQLAPILGQPESAVLEKVTDRKRGFVYLQRTFPSSRARGIEKLNIEGIELIPASRRIYPQRFLASQLLGFVGIDGHGLSGLEYSQNRELAGHSGQRRIVKDALGQPISLRDEHAMRAGHDLQLTLDSSIQDRTEKVLAEVGLTHSPKGAMALVMDPRNGELLAIANWPKVDANDPTGAPDYAKQDRAVQAAYEPGSTFKAFTVAAALEQHLVTPSTPFNLAPVIQVADRTIHEAEPRGTETLTTAQILAHSSNVGAVTIGLQLGAPRFDRWVRTFGFGQTTRSDLPAEGTGIVPRLDRYSGSSMGNLPIGQGLAVTPLQMATAYAAIANGGILRPAHVVRAVDGKLVRLLRGRRIISRTTAANVRTMLEGVLAAGGTASEVSIPGYRLAGKTGTAQKPDPVTGGYSDTKYVASFVGFAPAKDPKLLVAVMVDEPQGEYLGGLVAAPAVQQIMQFALPYLRIPPG